MTGSLDADVTVHVHHAEQTHIAFHARNGTPSVRVTLAQRGVLEEARRALDVGLLELKDVLPALDVDDRDVPKVFNTLHRIGQRLAFLLFGLQADVIQGLQTFWNSALPYGRNPDLQPPLVECIGDKDTFLPLELLPLYRMYPNAPGNREELIAECRTLVGFSCMVKRTMLLPAPPRACAWKSHRAGGCRCVFFIMRASRAPGRSSAGSPRRQHTGWKSTGRIPTATLGRPPWRSRSSILGGHSPVSFGACPTRFCTSPAIATRRSTAPSTMRSS